MSKELTAPHASGEEEGANVCVALKIRPLVTSELDDGCRESLFVTPGCPQVSTGQHTFTYDHVFGGGGSGDSLLYPRLVAPLVAGLFKGYNATVFAYGQTGSGKTYTMGSEYKAGGRCQGVIPDAINDMFNRIEAAREWDITVRVSFVEIHKEEIKDLLLTGSSGPRCTVTIRETQSGGVALYGAVEKEVRTREELAAVLEEGTLCRTTASTKMNNTSSRSHAIFSITLEQRRQQAQPNTPTGTPGGEDEDNEDEEGGVEEVEGVEDYLCAKMHLVDLAGSERAKRTKAEGARLREGIHINRGLLALGNVINAIVDGHKHVPYRDSKLTRLLQDSLGGNSRTVMIACVSPADSNFEESLNTLRYADRARHIRNKPVVNRDPMAAQLAALRSTIAQLRGENLALRRALSAAAGGDGAVAEALMGGGSRGGGALDAVVERLQIENSALESENLRLKLDMEELQQEVARTTDRCHTAQAQSDILRMQLQHYQRQQQGGQGGDAGPMGELPMPGLDVMKGYVARIAELEAELKAQKASMAGLSFMRRRLHPTEPPHTPGAGTPGYDPMMSPGPDGSPGPGVSGLYGDEPSASGLEHDGHEADGSHAVDDNDMYMAEMAARMLQQEQMKKEMSLLQRQLESKERKMVELMKAGALPNLKQHYDRVLKELEQQRDQLVAERKALTEKLQAVSAANEEERKRLETHYKERIQQYDQKLQELRHKERENVAMSKLKARTEDAHRRLAADIARIKQQKVAMQKQLDANLKQFAQWRVDREKELGQLRKQSRKDRTQIQHMEAVQAKTNAVLQRKISEATAARKKLKELMEVRRNTAQSSAAAAQQVAAAAAQQPAGNVEMQPNVRAPMLRSEKDRREWLLKELDMCNMSSEFRKVIDGELAQRAEASRKLKDLEKHLTMLDQYQPTSPLLAAGGVVEGTPGSDLSALSPASAVVFNSNLQLGPEGRAKLLAKKKELEDKVAYHNAQISDLQVQWERQKQEEESRGAGAVDGQRWLGLRSVVECRELLRTLFKLSVEGKCLNNDLTVDVIRSSEELDLLRVQLEGAQKKSAQYKRVAASLKAALNIQSAAVHHGAAAQDETDKHVDAVLEQLAVARNSTPAAPPVADEADTDMVQAAGEEGNPDTPGASQAAVEPKVLDFLSPVPSGARARVCVYGASALRYTVSDDEEEDDGQEDEEVEPRGKDRDADMMDVDDSHISISDEEEDGEHASDEEDDELDEDEESEDDEDDANWDPTTATPARNTRRSGSQRYSSVLPGANGSRRPSRDDALESGEQPGGSGAPQQQRRSSGAVNGAGRSGRRSSGSGGGAVDAVAAAHEADVLDHLNRARLQAGKQRVPKVTVAVLKEALKGQTIGGQVWHAGNKNRAALIRDYCRRWGLQDPPQPQLQGAASGNSDPQGSLGGFSLHADGASRALKDHAAQGMDWVDGGAGSGGGGLYTGPSPLRASHNAGGMSVAGDAYAQGFSFSPHAASGLPGPQASPSPSPSGTRRPTTGSPGMGPWARSSLNVQPTSARPFTNWASSLRSSSSLPAGSAAMATVATTAAPGQGSGGVAGGTVAASASLGAAAGMYSSRRHHAWVGSNDAGPDGAGELPVGAAGGFGAGNGVGGTTRSAMDYRSAILSPPSSSPLSNRANAPGSASPRSTPLHRSVNVPGGVGRAPGSMRNSLGSWATGGSPGSASRPSRMSPYEGGENMQPGPSPGSASGGKGGGAGGKPVSPLVALYNQKQRQSEARNKALKEMLRENLDGAAGAVRGGTGGSSAGVDGALGAGGAAGGVPSSMDAGRAMNFRDVTAMSRQKQVPIWR